MDAVTRRSFLVRGSAGAAGVAAVAGGGLALSSSNGDRETALSSEELEDLDGPVLLEITNPAAGEVDVLFRDREVRLTDQALVARVLRAAR